MAERKVVIPTIPPISSIADPATRIALQAIIDQYNVRNGNVGTGKDAFLTRGELRDVFAGKQLAGSSRAAVGQLDSEGFLNGRWVDTILSKIEDSITQSRIWRVLGDRITWIETPEWFQGKFGAAIKTEQNIRQEADSAIAQTITTNVTNINSNLALVQQRVTAVSDQAGATARSVTTLQTSVAGVRSSAEQAFELASTIDGRVKGTWSVKFDLNGYVSGIGLGLEGLGGSTVSTFLARADRFAIGSPQAPGITPAVPFTVYTTSQTLPDGTQVLPGVYISDLVVRNGSIGSAKIALASIDEARIRDLAVGRAKIGNLAVDTAKIADLAVSNAKIGDLAVDTIKIAGEAVVVPRSVSGGANINGVININGMPSGESAHVIIIASASIPGTGTGGDPGETSQTLIGNLYLDGVLIRTARITGFGDLTLTYTGAAYVANGSHVVQSVASVAPGSAYSPTQNIMIFATKR